MGDTLKELTKQKEDIQILLSTLEEAYNDASITKEHYDEVKGKNQKKMEEINKKIILIEAKPPGESGSENPEEPDSKPNKGKPGRPKGSKTKPQSAAPAQPAPAAPAATPPTDPAEDMTSTEEGYSGVPQPLTDVAGATDAELVRPDKVPGGAKRSLGEPGTIKYTAGEIKDMLNKILKEIRPAGIEVAPRVDKLEVSIEKIRAYVEAMKDERSSGKENIQRLNEEIGEIRSNVSNADRKVSETEIKVLEIDSAMGGLRPARFTKSLEEKEKNIKLHEARLDKLDDLNSVMLKKLGQIEDVLKRLGSLEKIVNFSKEAAKRLVEIENREKKINRVADKIDGIFMELNKRLDEFVLYKAKQDTLDELNQEMMKSMDDINTKMGKFADKENLENFRDSIQQEIAQIRASGGASPEVQRLQDSKTEIEGLIAMLDEQFKAGALPESEYKKTKTINQQRLSDIDKRISAAQSGSGLMLAAATALNTTTGSPGQEAQPPAQSGSPSPQQWADKAASQPGTQAAKFTEPVAQRPGTQLTDAQEHATESKEASPAGAKLSVQPTEPAAGSEKPAPAQVSGAQPEELHKELDESHKDGLIGKESLEKTKGLIGGAKKLFHRKGKEEGK